MDTDMDNNPTFRADMLTLNVENRHSPMVWGRQGFVLSASGEKTRSLKIEDDVDASPVWREKQNTAVGEYIEVHEREVISPSMVSLYKLFGAYIGNGLHEPGEGQQPNILDIGCGIGRRLPLYIRMLKHEVNYVGLDAINIHPERDYLFLCSRFETLMKVPELEKQFDVFIFGTSLDHFEDLDEVARTVKYLAAPRAKVFFWIGLHDMELAAIEEGASRLGEMFKSAKLFNIALRSLSFIFWTFPRVALSLIRHRYQLQHGQEIDKFHFWYFTDRDIPGVMAKFGELSDITYVTGGGSVFTTCRVTE